MVRFLSAFLLFSLLFVCPAGAQPYGIDSRAANTTLLISDLPVEGSPGDLEVQLAFPNLTFSMPVFLTDAPDDSGRLFVVEQEGRISAFPHRSDVTQAEVATFLDISSRVDSEGERGLLGLAFDPDYGSNGQFYVYYTFPDGARGTTRVSRFTNDNPGDNSVDPEAEEIILQLKQPYVNHNGGMIAFGPSDAMLYIALGDGGSGHDPLNSGQNTSTLFGNILRIDVRGTTDSGLAYAIPVDNPFYSTIPSATRQEIYAYGLRNPWRFSFDRQHGFLFAGDVGQNRWEEVDVIVPGGNYGWKIMEGDHCRGEVADATDGTICLDGATVGLIRPIAEYPRSEGRSITGGYVYYGPDVPSLYGTYLYADYVSGKIFGLIYDGSDTAGPFTLVENSGLNVSGFGQDATGEVYLLNHGGGKIYVVRPITGSGSGAFPTRLSDLAALLAAGSGIDQTTQGIIPYEPSAKLWSDGSLKERYMALPDLEQIEYRKYGGWQLPEQSVTIKNFLLPLDERDPEGSAKRLETRLLIKNEGRWHGFTYEWNEEETDAQLLTTSKNRSFTILDEDGQPFDYKWYYPSRADCNLCHTIVANSVLGLNTAQMNFDFEYPASGVTDNQLRTYDHIALFTQPLPDVPANLPAMPDPADAGAALRARARAYLAGNCSMCHQPGGPTNSAIDLRWQTADGAMKAIGAEPGDPLGVPGAKIIALGDPDRSTLVLRMNLRGSPLQMPPVATSRVDEQGLEIVRQWIASLGQSTNHWRTY